MYINVNYLHQLKFANVSFIPPKTLGITVSSISSESVLKISSLEQPTRLNFLKVLNKKI